MLLIKKRVLSRRFLRPAMQIGLEAANARRMAQKLAAGLVLEPGEEQQLQTMPPTVQDAVRACFRPNSRYLPSIIKKQRAVGPRPLQVNPVDYWHPIDRGMASALLSGDAKATSQRRLNVVYLPSHVPGFGKVVKAFAQSYSVSQPKIRLAMRHAEKLEEELRDQVGEDDQSVDLSERPNKGSKRKS